MSIGSVVHALRVAAPAALVGHHSGIRASARVNRALRQLRRETSAHVPAEAAARARQLRRSGYLVLSPGYPAQLIRSIHDAMSIAEDDRFSVPMGGRIKNAVRYIVDPVRHIPSLKDLLTPELADVVRGWYGSEFAISSVRAWRIAHLPAEEQAFHHYGNLWHVDGHTVDVMKLFVQITPDAGVSGSAFRLISRADTRKAMRRGYVRGDRMLGLARRLIERRTVVFDHAPGVVAFVDTNRCLHRAGIPRLGETRFMVQFMFKPATSAPASGDYFAAVPHDPNVHAGAIA